jgi:hypothetical protein
VPRQQDLLATAASQLQLTPPPSTHPPPPPPPPAGYCGNWAGPSGMGAAVAIGFFPSLSAHAVRPYSVWDAVPGDLVASAILATAAAVGAGLQSELAAATGSGAWVPALRAGGRGAGAAATLAAPRGAGPAAAAGGGGAAAPAGKAGLLHARSISLSAFTDDTMVGSLIPAGGRSSGGASGSGELSPTARSSDDPDHLAALDQNAPKPRPGPGAATPPKAATPAAAAGALPPPRLAGGAAAQPLLIVHATTSTTYPATVYEAYNTAVDFLRAHGSPVSILVGGARFLPNMPPGWEPSPGMVKFWKVYNWVKVMIVCFLLRWVLCGSTRASTARRRRWRRQRRWRQQRRWQRQQRR